MNLQKQLENATKSNHDLKAHNSELKKELKELRDIHAQLAKSFNELCERNSLLQTQNESLRNKPSQFQTVHQQNPSMATPPKPSHNRKTPTKTASPPKVVHSAPTNSVPLHNSFRVLNAEDTSPDMNEPATPSAWF